MDNQNPNQTPTTANPTPTQTTPAIPPATPASPAPVTFPVQNPNQASHSSSATPPGTPVTNQNPVKTLSKLPLIIIGALLVLGVLIGGFFIFNQVTSDPKDAGPIPTTYDVPRGT